MRTLSYSFAIVSLLALCSAGSASFAQTADTGGGASTFGGAIAPARPASPAPATEPEGYRGVMSGKVAPAPHAVDNAPADTTAAAPAQPNKRKPRASTDTAQQNTGHHRAQRAMSTPDQGMTPRPGYKEHKVLTAEDLKNIAAMTGVEVRLDKLPDNMAGAMHMPSHVYPLVSLPSPRRDGMLPTEYTAKQAVDRLMQQVDDAGRISPDAKKKAATDAIAAMSGLANAMRIKRDMPAQLYQAMGVPQTYITETHEGASKATDRLEEAIKTLQQESQ